VPVANEYVLPKNNNGGTYNDGYDFDGELGPFFDAVAGENDFSSDEKEEDEETGQSTQLALINNESIPVISEAAPVNDSPPPLLTEPQVMAMTANQLKDELAKRKLSKNRVKAELQ
jgi:hypothetical protein